MAVMISMLRGVNLGAHRRIRMEDLRKVYESIGLRDVETHVQSGNVVFRTAAARAPKDLARQLEEAIEQRFGFHSTVVLRTAAELREVIARNPFAGRAGIEAAKFLVWFLAADPGDDARRKALALAVTPEEVHAKGSELYIYYTEGLARPKLPLAAIEKALSVAGTGRNWNTVGKLLGIAERLEGTPVRAAR
jgi:uncharacterized protein (DUF1697 family)